jgi:hypothetical protein
VVAERPGVAGRSRHAGARAHPDQMEPLVDMDALKIKELKHAEIEKVEQVFLDML